MGGDDDGGVRDEVGSPRPALDCLHDGGDVGHEVLGVVGALLPGLRVAVVVLVG